MTTSAAQPPEPTSLDADAGVDWSPRTDPAQCRPWCPDREQGHTPIFADHCSTRPTMLTLSLGQPIDYGEGDMQPNFVEVYLWQDVGEDVTVNLAHHEDEGPLMTPAEARQVGEELIRLADLAEAAER